MGKLNLLMIIFFVLALMMGACSKTPLEKYVNVLEHFDSEHKVELSVLTTSFLEAFCLKSFESEKIFINKNVLIQQDGEKFLLLHPYRVELDVDKKNISHIEFADINDEYIVVGNGRVFYIFNKEGKVFSSSECEGVGDIKSLLFYGEDILYSRNSEIRRYSIMDNIDDIFIEQTFSSPYKKYYKAQMYESSSNLGISVGIAGLYHISAIECNSRSVLIKNVVSSSGEFVIVKSDLYCVKGNACKWSVFKYDLKTKGKQRIYETEKIVNIYMGDVGFFLNKGSGNELVMYDGGDIKIPLLCKVKGVCGSCVVLKYNNKFYIIEISIFYEKLKELKSRGFNIGI